MNETTVVGLLGGFFGFAATALSAWLIYRRAIKVERVKNEQDTEVKLIDKWREYAESVEARVVRQKVELEELRTENRALSIDLSKAREEISELRCIVELQADQLRTLEARLDDIDGEGAPE